MNLKAVLSFLIICAAHDSPQAHAGTCANLRCEYLHNPLGIDSPRPRLSWEMQSEHRGDYQTAYQIIVASSPELLKRNQGDLWDSGKVLSDQSIQIEYAGKNLASRIRYHWRVRLWDKNGEPSEWSQPATWSMGLLDPTDWQSAWVRAAGAPWPEPGTQGNKSAPLLRKVFELGSMPEEALVYVNVLGYYELFVNGHKAGQDVLSPAISDYSRRSFYRTYDIRSLLRQGPNCIGLWMDSGWHAAGPIARVQLELKLDGQRTVVGTDTSWACAPSSRTRTGGWKWGDMGGESVDARKEISDWSEPGKTGGEWLPVSLAQAPESPAVAQPCPPNHIGAVLPLVSLNQLASNTWQLDFGTNLTGWLRLRLPALEAGRRITLHYADKRFQTPQGDETPAGKIGISGQREFKNASGTVAYQTFNQVDEFISAGNTGEQFCSKFNYHGFRYVIVEGLRTAPRLQDAEALLIESALEPTGDFACSNDLFNRIHQVNLWTLRCLNLGGYMVDCPHRERLGYGDGQVGIESLLMARDAAGFYAKWAEDWLQGQNPATGEIPYTAPKFVDSGGGPGWGGAGCVLPWKLYLYFGDRRLLERAYDATDRYLGFLASKCTNGVLRKYGGDWDFIGDWVAPGRGMDTSNWPPKPAAELFNNCYRIYLLDLHARAADALGRPGDATAARNLIRQLQPLVHAAFWDPDRQGYGPDEQAYRLMPLMTGVVPPELRPTVMQKLEEGILYKQHLDTGMLGTYFLIQHLQNTGRSDLLGPLFAQTNYPGWGYMLGQDATTFWEQWNGYYSQIHSCFTSPGGWFYQGLAGIQADEASPGFKRFSIKPAIVGDLQWVKAHYDSIHGRIVSHWQRNKDSIEMEISVPANTSATVYVPAATVEQVKESGTLATEASGIQFLRMSDRTAVFTVGAGHYRFVSGISASDLPDSTTSKSR